MAEALVGEGRQPWWMPGIQLTRRNIYIYIYIYVYVYTSTKMMGGRRREA